MYGWNLSNDPDKNDSIYPKFISVMSFWLAWENVSMYTWWVLVCRTDVSKTITLSFSVQTLYGCQAHGLAHAYNAVFGFGFYSREITDVSHASTRTLILAFSLSLTLFKRTLSNIAWLTCVARHIHVSFDDLDTVSRSQGHQTCIHIRLQVIFNWISRSQLWQKIENESCSVSFV